MRTALPYLVLIALAVGYVLVNAAVVFGRRAFSLDTVRGLALARGAPRRSEFGGVAMELLCGFATAPGATATALTMNTGNSNVIRNGLEGKKILLLSAWADWQTAGVFRIRSPKLHDNVQGIRLAGTASIPQPMWPTGAMQPLYPQDTLTLDITGSAVAGDIETAALLVYYEDQPGIAARFIDSKQLHDRTIEILTVENTLALGTAGNYSGEEAINAEFDQFKVNEDYALIGYNVTAECAAVRWRGVDTGNLGIGGPGIEDLKHLTANWFAYLSDAYGIPLIPVFNSAQRGAILIDGAQDENGADTTVTSIFARLRPR